MYSTQQMLYLSRIFARSSVSAAVMWLMSSSSGGEIRSLSNSILAGGWWARVWSFSFCWFAKWRGGWVHIAGQRFGGKKRNEVEEKFWNNVQIICGENMGEDGLAPCEHTQAGGANCLKEV